jgi:hypothetical protein
MNRSQVTEIILQELSKSKDIVYTSAGRPTIMTSGNIVSLDFTAKSNDFSGSVTFYSRRYEPLSLKAEYENRSAIIDDENAKQRINADVDRINDYVNNLINSK